MPTEWIHILCIITYAHEWKVYMIFVRLSFSCRRSLDTFTITTFHCPSFDIYSSREVIRLINSWFVTNLPKCIYQVLVLCVVMACYFFMMVATTIIGILMSIAVHFDLHIKTSWNYVALVLQPHASLDISLWILHWIYHIRTPLWHV